MRQQIARSFRWLTVAACIALPVRVFAEAPLSDLDRAEARIARGDLLGARSLLETEAATDTANGAVWSGLLGCRLVHGDRIGAAEAWIAWVGDRSGPDRAWIEAESGACPGLPPVWTPAEAQVWLSMNGSNEGSPISQELARLYRSAARKTVGVLADESDAGQSASVRADPLVRFVSELVRAQGADPADRDAARDALRRRLRADPPRWERIWVQLGVGVSLLKEPDRSISDAGAAELVRVIIMPDAAAPGLDRLARGLLISYFESTGRTAHAAAVRDMDHRTARAATTEPDDSQVPGLITP